jgi:RNA polymerase sigma factor (sigma-70 family)
MKNSSHEGLNVAQKYFYDHLTELLAYLNEFRGKIDLEELEQVVGFELRHINDDKFDNLKAPLAYLYKFARFKAIDLYRQTLSRTANGKQVAFSDYAIAWLPDKPGTNPEEAMLAKLHLEEVWHRCNKEERELLGYIFDDLTSQEIAAAMRISYDAVRTRKKRLFKKLRSKNPP